MEQVTGAGLAFLHPGDIVGVPPPASTAAIPTAASTLGGAFGGMALSQEEQATLAKATQETQKALTDAITKNNDLVGVKLGGALGSLDKTIQDAYAQQAKEAITSPTAETSGLLANLGAGGEFTSQVDYKTLLARLSAPDVIKLDDPSLTALNTFSSKVIPAVTTTGAAGGGVVHTGDQTWQMQFTFPPGTDASNPDQIATNIQSVMKTDWMGTRKVIENIADQRIAAAASGP
jgi:hypothetical protein